MSEPIVQKAKERVRIATHIEGLDDLLLGGIPQGHSTLVFGSPGTTKTSLVLKTFFEEVKINKRNSLFISLDQDYYSLYNQLVSLGLSMNEISIVHIDNLTNFGTIMTKVKANTEGTIIVIDKSTMKREIKQEEGEIKGWLNIIKNLIKKIKQSVELDLFALDSLEMLENLAGFTNPKKTIKELFSLLEDLYLTSYFISERKNPQNKPIFDEDIYCDGIIYLSLAYYSRKAVRELTILKMRQTKCTHDTHTLRYDKGTFLVEHGGENPLV